MKAVKNMVLREIVGEYVLIPTGEAAKELYGLVSLTESGKLLWEKLSEECGEDELVAAVLAEYDVDEATAKKDVAKFLNKLREAKLLEEQR